MLQGTFATHVVGTFENSANRVEREYSARIRGAGRLKISDAVLEETRNVRMPEWESPEWGAMIRNFKLPFKTTFVEICLEKEPPSYEGILYHYVDDALHITACDHLFGRTRIDTYRWVVKPEDAVLHDHQGEPIEPDGDVLGLFGAMFTLQKALALIIVLTTPGTPADIEPEEVYTKLNKQRIPKGRHPLLSFYPVKWNVERANQPSKPGAGGRTVDTRRRHLVRGHFKVTRSGTYWWKPFYRGVGARPADGRDHCVAIIAGEGQREMQDRNQWDGDVF